MKSPSSARRSPRIETKFNHDGLRVSNDDTFPTAPGGAEQLQLQQPVLGGDETLRTQEVRRVGREDVGDAQVVAQHGDRGRQAGKLHVAVDLRMARRAQLEIDARAGHHDEKQQNQDGPFQGLAHRVSPGDCGCFGIFSARQPGTCRRRGADRIIKDGMRDTIWNTS